jgi:hypothetical protein
MRAWFPRSLAPCGAIATVADADSAGSIFHPSARERISQVTRAKMAAFLTQIPGPALKTVLRRLRPIDGFRADSDAATEEQKRRLVWRLLEDNGRSASERDWLTFRNLWWQWVQARFGGTPIIAATRHFMNVDEAGRNVALEDLLLACIAEAERHTVSREALATFFEFGPIAETTDTEEVVALASLDSDLTGQQLLAKLPTIVGDTERRISEVESRSARLEIRLEELAENARSVKRDNATASESGDDVVNQLKLALAAQAGLASRIEFLEREASTGNFSTLTDRITGLESTAESHRTSLDGALDTITVELSSLKERLSLLSRGEGNPLGAVMEKQIGAIAENSRPFDGKERRRQESRRIFAFTQFEVTRPFTLTDIVIGNAPEMAQAIEQNLLSVGVNRNHTAELSREVGAALCAGQLVSFTGSLGFLAAIASMYAVSGDTQVAQVAVGWHSEQNLQASSFQPFIGRDNCVNIFLNGANRSAFDAYGSWIIEKITMRQSGVSDVTNLSFFCCLVDGPTGLPPTPAYSAIGPIIDTDAISWRKQTRDEVPLLCGRLSAPPAELSLGNGAVPEMLPALISMLDTGAIRSRRVFELSARNAGAALLGLAQYADIDVDTVGKSLFANWLVPYLLSCGVKKEAIARQLDASDLAEYATDARIAAILGRPAPGATGK